MHMDIKISKKYLLNFLALFILLEPTYIGVQLKVLHTLFYYAKLLVALILLILYLYDLIKNDVNIVDNRYIFLYILFYLFITVITFFNAGDVTDFIGNFMLLISLLFLHFLNRNKIWCLLKAFLLLFEVLIYVNLILMIIYPNGLYSNNIGEYWLLGLDNSFINTMLPALCLACMFIYKDKFKLRYAILVTVIVLTFLIRWAITPLLGIVVFIISLFFVVKRKGCRLQIVNPTISFIILSLGTILFVILGKQYWFSGFIENVLHKDITFTDRIYIWDRALKCINENLFFGFGHLDSLQYETLLRGSHPHNMVLFILMQAGLVGALFSVLILFMALKEIKRHKNHKVTLCISAAICAFLIMGIGESLSAFTIHLPIIWAFNLKYIIGEKNEQCNGQCMLHNIQSSRLYRRSN